MKARAYNPNTNVVFGPEIVLGRDEVFRSLFIRHPSCSSNSLSNGGAQDEHAGTSNMGSVVSKKNDKHLYKTKRF